MTILTNVAIFAVGCVVGFIAAKWMTRKVAYLGEVERFRRAFGKEVQSN